MILRSEDRLCCPAMGKRDRKELLVSDLFVRAPLQVLFEMLKSGQLCSK